MFNNTTTPSPPPPSEDRHEFALNVTLRIAFVALNTTTLPLGVSLEYFLIMRLLKKPRKRLWDVLSLALECVNCLIGLMIIVKLVRILTNILESWHPLCLATELTGNQCFPIYAFCVKITS